MLDIRGKYALSVLIKPINQVIHEVNSTACVNTLMVSEYWNMRVSA